jgi:DNA excision repair protein ERCC-3
MIGETQYTLDDVWTAINAILQAKPYVTTADVADEVGCNSETARLKLYELENDGQLESASVGARAKVWYRPDYDPDALGVVSDPSATKPTTQSRDSATKQMAKPGVAEPSATKQTAGERVMFFPSRREFAVHSPSDNTKRILSQSAHLVDSSGPGRLYKVSQADIWNSAYDTFDDLVDDLQTLAGDQWDDGFESRIRDDWERAHQFRLRTESENGNSYTVLEATDEDVFEDVAKRKLEHNDHYTQYVGDTGMRLKRGAEADVKELLYEEGYPVIDERRLDQGAELPMALRDDIELRDYQQEWVDHFVSRNNGVFVGPSGSGKTVAALGAMAAVSGETLILVPNRELATQWREELQDKLVIDDGGVLQNVNNIGEYHGGEKNIRPITIATYDTAAMSRHRKLFNEREWGLVIADECHHAVADTWKRFREIQSTARLGLSATPVRESGDAKEIYTLIGPPVGSDWGRLFEEGFVSRPDVEIVMVPWASEDDRERYQNTSGNRRLIEAAKNPAKTDVIRSLLEQHTGEKTIIFVDWVRQGKNLADALELPFIYGQTNHDRRDELYQEFRDGGLEALIISRVGDEGIDLPDAEVAILASTMGSSRSQTGQRAGRTMRPDGSSQVYILLTKGSGEADWGRESTQFLAEKGIDITKTDWSDEHPETDSPHSNGS